MNNELKAHINMSKGYNEGNVGNMHDAEACVGGGDDGTIMKRVLVEVMTAQ